MREELQPASPREDPKGDPQKDLKEAAIIADLRLSPI
jgi:hypothetical protein